MTTEERQTRDFFFRWMIIIGIINLVILAVMAVGLVANFGNTTDEIRSVQAKQVILTEKLRASNIISCERGRGFEAYEIVEAGREPDAAHRQQELFNLFQFRDCKRSEDVGRRVYLTNEQAETLVEQTAIRMGVTDWDKRPK